MSRLQFKIIFWKMIKMKIKILKKQKIIKIFLKKQTQKTKKKINNNQKVLIKIKILKK